jgi:hypothetical protein
VPLAAAGSLFPGLVLEDPAGLPLEPKSFWSQGEALFVLGHRNCKTTRQTLPYVELIHRRGAAPGRVLVVLQDDRQAALELAGELDLTVPLACEPEPYPLSQALGLEVVPSLLLVSTDGRVLQACEAFRKPELDAFAARLGVSGSLFAADDPMPAMKPG